MGAAPKLQIPATTAELLQNPQRVKDAFELLNMLLAARVQVTPANTTLGIAQLMPSSEGIIIPIPLQLGSAIADSTASAASVSAQLNLLLVALRKTGQLPVSA